LWLCGWGGIAAVALIILAITTQTEAANQRLRRIFASNESSAIAQMPPRISQLESETHLLAAQVRALTSERDRLAGRIGLLEKSIDDLTGTVKKQAAAQAAAVAALAAKATAPAGANTAATTGSIAAATLPPRGDTLTTQAIPLPSARAASPAAVDPEPAAVKQSEFGLDLGGGSTIEAVRQRWITVKASFGPLLGGMYPVAARESRSANGGYRLVVGPLPNSAAAAGLCAHFIAARTACKAVKFEGDQIAQQ